jgi:8-oxo-dGTP diphosphatase
LLIEKQRPEFQRGKMNGIGGHVEKGERPLAAMIREFEEETGVHFEKWHPAAILMFGSSARVYIYSAVDADACRLAQTTTDEAISLVHMNRLDVLTLMPNLHRLIPVAEAREIINDYGQGWQSPIFKEN